MVWYRRMFFCGVLDLADREDVRQRNPDLAHFKSNFHFTHAASFWLIVSLSCNVLGHVGEGFGLQEDYEIVVGEQFVEGCDDENEFRVTQSRLPYQELLALAFSPIGIDQALGTGARFSLAGVGVTLFADEAALVHDSFDRADGDLVELFGLVGFEQLPLHFRVVGLGYVHGDAQGDSAADRGIQQPFFAGLFRAM